MSLARRRNRHHHHPARRALGRTAMAATLLLAAAPDATAQLGKLAAGGGGQGSGDNNAPVTFEADSVSYDKDNGLITATGHVEAWQNNNVLRADKVTFDRNTNVAAAYGHVALVQPDGEIMFANYAELTQGMRQGVLKGMRAILQRNGKLAANGVRRTEGKVNDLSRAVYTACNVGAQHPDRAPLWQLRAYDAVQDLEHKRIDYQDMYLDVLGVPVFYMPAFSMSDPSVKRQSGFLIPDISPSDDYLGPFASIPYFWVLGKSSDVLLTPLVATKSGPQLTAAYRRSFNNGVIRVTGAIAYDSSRQTSGSAAEPVVSPSLDSVEGYLFAHADFAWNDNWHYGADINLATNADYLRDYRIPGYGADVLGSSAFIEGFGVGSYSRLDGLVYQGLNQYAVNDSTLPFVLPRYIYDLFLPQDPLGGRLRVSTEDFDVYRPDGASDQRASLVLNWDRPWTGPLGTRWTLTGNLQSEAYNADKLELIPDYLAVSHSVTDQALPTAALKVEWPLIRLQKSGASQTIEPIVQVITAPNAPESVNDALPNEDALNYTFTDTTLFDINRFDGIDRQDSGTRVNAGVHGNWTLANGMYFDGLVGESYREHIDNRALLPYSGLENHLSDMVSRLSFVPTKWLDFTGRLNYDHDRGDVSFADAISTVGVKLLHVGVGYLYSSTNPYYYDDTDYHVATATDYAPGFLLPRNELTLSAASTFGRWSLSAFARRNLTERQYSSYTGYTEGTKFVSLGGDVSWQNECLIANLNYSKRYTYINGDDGDQTILFTLTFKTLGAIGFNG